MITRERSRQPKISELQVTLVVYQKVGTFDISMQHLIDMAIVQARKQLLHVALDLRHGEAHPRPVGEPGEVVVHVLEDHVDAPLVLVAVDWLSLLISLRAWGGDDLLELDNVLVVELLEDLDLPYRRDREAFALVVHADLLEGDDLVRLHLPRHVNLPVGSLADLLELLEAVDAAGAPRGVLFEVELPRRRHRHGFRSFPLPAR